jgi:hypothetical protein
MSKIARRSDNDPRPVNRGYAPPKRFGFERTL